MKRKKPNQYSDIFALVIRSTGAGLSVRAAWDSIPKSIRESSPVDDVAELVRVIATEAGAREIAEGKLKAIHPLAYLVDDGLIWLSEKKSSLARRLASRVQKINSWRIERKRRLLLAGLMIWTGKI